MFGSIDWNAAFFTLFATLSCVFALGVLFSNNIVRMAFYLVLCLGAVAGLFFLAGAEFVGAMQLMIYVGGTLVLLIFGVMLTAQSRFIRLKASGGDWILALLAGGALLLLLLRTAYMVDDWRQTLKPGQAAAVEPESTTAIGLALTGVRVDGDSTISDQPPAGVRFDGRSGYLLPFVIVSVHLLVVLVGSAYLARTKRRADRPTLER
ncbi:MAG: NADH-quinone oxidoreductase subunit J [Planctomycetes bacterium]|nr:NADH-quinone oxidoreductase subunit J [Planctomycetota bacterium]